MSVDAIIDRTIGREGEFVDHPSDPGGATCWGITERVARRYGYGGPMASLPRQTAVDIYRRRYFEEPGFALIAPINVEIAEKLFDVGVNMGPAVASMHLQRLLNALNRQGKDYPDIKTDGDAGPGTRASLKAFLTKRGKDGLTVMLRGLNCLQGSRYVEIAEARATSEDFVFGWLLNRVQ